MKVFYLAAAAVGKPGMPTFQEDDFNLLRNLGYDVRSLIWRGHEYRELIRGVRSADVVLAWHIGRHSWLASWLGRPLACIVGGYEFVYLPDLDYGGLRSSTTRAMTRRVWRKAELLYVSQALADEATSAFGSPGRAHVLPTGYDSSFWKPGDGPRRELVVSVCHAPTQARFRLKGVDVLLEVAARLPNLEFAVAGVMPPDFSPPAKGNVRFTGWLDRKALRELYQEAKVYAQLSVHEGFPNAVCEAMLCGCVPVGTPGGGTHEAIDDCGFVVPRDAEAVVGAIRIALRADDKGAAARSWVSTRFSLERRRQGLKEILERLAVSN